MADAAFNTAKALVGYAASTVADIFYADTAYLQIRPSPAQSLLVIQRAFKAAQEQQKEHQVYHKVWEIAKMEDPTISGLDWGQHHAFENLERLQQALCRLGFLPSEDVRSFNMLSPGFGEGGPLGSQYFSLSEKTGRDPLPGPVGYVNGMGVPSLEHAGRDATQLSDLFVDGNNIHCVYNATHQRVWGGADGLGFIRDVLRMKAVDGGSYTRTSYLIAQQWVDFLTKNPNKKFLQVALSEGAVHLQGALRLLQSTAPELVERLCIINLAPAYFILPTHYNIQVMNFVKAEDRVILPWAINADKIRDSLHITIVPHTGGGDPHNPFCDDFVSASKRYFDRFMQDGNLY
ncbi:MAG: hypothetical protein LVR00_07030 [Rhabdochlamydiaceae bacterium]|jgi:hypothetical protein